MTFQMPGGRLGELFGGKKVMKLRLDHYFDINIYIFKVLAIAMGLVSILTLLIPEAAKLSGTYGYPYYLVIIR